MTTFTTPPRGTASCRKRIPERVPRPNTLAPRRPSGGRGSHGRRRRVDAIVPDRLTCAVHEGPNLLAIVAIIPARFGSTRLPGKPLSTIHGKPMVQHVWERARQARAVDRVLVATDDERIAEAVRAFGGEVAMTSREHATGTDRLAEAARATEAEIVVNVQGDEPMLDAAFIDGVVAPLRTEPDLPMSTVSLPLTDVEEMLSSAVVKVVTDARGDAL